MQARICIPAFILLLALFGLRGISSAQADTIWNRTDENGWKQGYWKKSYPDGELMYRGYFKNDKPLGKLERFYEDGKLKAVLFYAENPETARATMYFRNGRPGAAGKYIGQKRDSIWDYYSYYTGTLSCRESYRMGEKEGPTIKYYPEGPMAELLQWKSGMKHGKWEQYYEDSTLRLSAGYEMDRLHGPYRIYNRKQLLILDGSYKMGQREGDWTFYDSEGRMERVLRYDEGDIQNSEELEKWMDEFMDNVEKDLGKIPEPDLENFFDRMPKNNPPE